MVDKEIISGREDWAKEAEKNMLSCYERFLLSFDIKWLRF
jgi:hypothetical protein